MVNVTWYRGKEASESTSRAKFKRDRGSNDGGESTHARIQEPITTNAYGVQGSTARWVDLFRIT